MSSDSTYAVLELKGNEKASELFNLLLSNGFSCVTFLNHLAEHPTMRTFIEERDPTKKCTGECQRSSSSGDGVSVTESKQAEIIPIGSVTTADLMDLTKDEPSSPAPEVANGAVNAVDLMDFSCDDDCEEQKPAAIYHGESSESPNNRASSEESVDERIWNILRAQTGSQVYSSNHEQPSTSSQHNKPFFENIVRHVPKGAPKKHAEMVKVNRKRQSADDTKAMMMCLMCGSNIQTNRSDRAVEHAKTHCPIAQYSCPYSVCGYSGHRIHHVERHMKTQHNIEGKPNDRVTPEMQDEWMNIFRQCFPSLADDFHSQRHIYKSIEDNTLARESQPTKECRLCAKMVSMGPVENGKIKSIRGLVRHAKTHCDQSQFVCAVQGCGFAHPWDRHRVFDHMKANHDFKGQPVNMVSPELQEAWVDAFQQCFPSLKDKISRFTFRSRYE